MAIAADAGTVGAMVPTLVEVVDVRQDLPDTVSFDLQMPEPFEFEPGQFTMLYAPGIGEAPISISGDPANHDVITHTVRAVGKVSQALCRLRPGDRVGVRGPYGVPWPVRVAEGGDVVLMAGGIGLAPLRPVLYHLLHHRGRYESVVLLYGARSPIDLLYNQELRAWRSRYDCEVEVTVDHGGADWHGPVGVVTKLLGRAPFDGPATTAMVCGPEIMMRFSARDLIKQEVASDRVYMSMERNMQCGVGWCGHCQFGPKILCRDGPVLPYPAIEELLTVNEI